VSEKLVTTVMTQVVENVCEELTRLFSCVAKFNENGSVQATLDLAAFQDAISPFLTQNSRLEINITYMHIIQIKFILYTFKTTINYIDYFNVILSRTLLNETFGLIPRSRELVRGSR
jgi:hypothetical protein